MGPPWSCRVRTGDLSNQDQGPLRSRVCSQYMGGHSPCKPPQKRSRRDLGINSPALCRRPPECSAKGQFCLVLRTPLSASRSSPEQGETPESDQGLGQVPGVETPRRGVLHGRAAWGMGCGCSSRWTSGRGNKVHRDGHRGGDTLRALRPGLSWDKAQHEGNSRLQPEGAGQMENCGFSPRNAPQLGMRRSSTGCAEQLQTQEKVLERSSCRATDQRVRSQARSGQEDRKTAA